MVDPILVDIEQSRKWGGHPKIADADSQADLTIAQANKMSLDSDFYVMHETNNFLPVSTDLNWGLMRLAATYHLASQFMGIFKNPEAVQDSRDLKTICDEYIKAINGGIGPTGSGDSPMQVLSTQYRNYRLNPLMRPYKSVF